MKLGVNPWTVYGWQLPEALGDEFFKALAQVGSQAVELILDEGYNSAETLLQRCGSLTASASEAGLAIPAVATTLFWQYNLASQNDDLRQCGLETVRAGCRVAQAYGAGVFLVVAGQQEPDTPYTRTYDTGVRTLREAAKFAAEAGVIIGVENVPTNFLCSPAEFARFIDDVDHPAVQAYLDFGNGASIGPGYAENWITAVEGRIALVHAKDYDFGLKAFCPCGQGDVDWERVFSALRSVGYDGPLIVETPPKGGHGQPSRAAGLQAAETSLRWLSQCLQAEALRTNG